MVSDWSDNSGLMRNSHPKISQSLIEDMDKKLGAIVSTLAIDTVSYYMLEFRNDILQRWMVQFNSYNKNGFPDNVWTTYLEKMITTSDHTIQVIMKPPKSFIRGKNSPLGSNVVIEYEHEIEPRKVANQILTVREHVCEEIINDLNVIQFENDEASRYAATRAKDGRESADKARKMTRMSSQSGSTPNRDRNFHEISKFLTDLSIELVRTDYLQHQDMKTASFLTSFLEKLKSDYQSMSVSDQFFSKNFGPRTFLEELYYLGITGSTSVDDIIGTNSNLINTNYDTSSNLIDKNKSDSDKSSLVNVLKLSQMISDTRTALALQIQGILRLQNTSNRKYYKMIKDYGGVMGFMGSRKPNQPKFQLLDLDEEKRQREQREREEAATAVATASNISATISPSSTKTKEVDSRILVATASASSTESSVNVSKSNNESEHSSDNVSDGPMKINEDVNLFDTDFNAAGPFFM